MYEEHLDLEVNCMKNLFAKTFTLIELISVIAILGILAAIVIPNISNLQREATNTATRNNIKNIQTGVEMYTLYNFGQSPTLDRVSPTNPQPVDFDTLYPKYLRNLPQNNNEKYWIDNWGTVWGSSVDSPKIISLSGGTLSWQKVEGAKSYNIYEVKGYSDSNSVLVSVTESRSKLSFILNTTETNVSAHETDSKIQIGKVYIVSALDSSGFETAPTGVGYDGYTDTLDITPEIVMGEFQNIKTLHAGRHNAFILTNDNKVFAAGLNNFGQLGLNNFANEKTFKEVVSLRGLEIKEMYSQQYTVYALTNSGDLYGWGKNQVGQLGTGNTTTQKLPVLIMSNVKEFEFGKSSGYEFNMALNKNNELYVWGSNNLHSLGLGDSIPEHRYVPTKMTFFNNKTIKTITASSHGGFVVTEDNKLYGWGYNTYGQMGNGSNQVITYSSPIENTYFSSKGITIDKLYSNEYSHFAIDSNNNLYSWGYNWSGLLGLGHTNNTYLPTIVPNISNVTKVHTYNRQTFVYTSDNKLYGWGHNSIGQTGTSSNNRFVLDMNNIVSHSFGQNYIMFVDNNNNVLASGQGSNGKLGTGDTVDVKDLTTISNLQDLKVSKVFAGIDETYLLTENGFLYGLGRNAQGGLGVGNIDVHLNPAEIIYPE